MILTIKGQMVQIRVIHVRFEDQCQMESMSAWDAANTSLDIICVIVLKLFLVDFIVF